MDAERADLSSVFSSKNYSLLSPQAENSKKLYLVISCEAVLSWDGGKSAIVNVQKR